MKGKINKRNDVVARSAATGCERELRAAQVLPATLCMAMAGATDEDCGREVKQHLGDWAALRQALRRSWTAAAAGGGGRRALSIKLPVRSRPERDAGRDVLVCRIGASVLFVLLECVCLSARAFVRGCACKALQSKRCHMFVFALMSFVGLRSIAQHSRASSKRRRAAWRTR